MMDIKQSFQNVVAWAKKHPWLAGGIGLLFVLLIIWAIRRGTSGASIDIVQTEEEPAGDFGSGGSGGSLLDSLTGGSGGITQTPPVYNAPVFDSLPALAPLQDAGWFDPGSIQDAFYQVPSVSYNDSAMVESGLAPARNLFWGNLSYDTKEVLPTKITTSAPVVSAPVAVPGPTAGNLFSGTLSYNTAEPLPTKIVSSQPSGKSPAYYLGKGNKYTGWIGGTYYKNGYPSQTESAQSKPGSPSTKPGATLSDYKGSVTSWFGGSI